MLDLGNSPPQPHVLRRTLQECYGAERNMEGFSKEMRKRTSFILSSANITIMSSFDETDIRILRILQQNSKLSTRELAKDLGSPITTVYAKIKRMEALGVISGYKAILNSKKLDLGTTAFILASFEYRPTGQEKVLSQRDIAKEIAKLAEVQEVHIISGDWDILVKIKVKDVDAIGRFVVDKLRTVRGIERTLTCVVFDTAKESPEISF